MCYRCLTSWFSAEGSVFFCFIGSAYVRSKEGLRRQRGHATKRGGNCSMSSALACGLQDVID